MTANPRSLPSSVAQNVFLCRSQPMRSPAAHNIGRSRIERDVDVVVVFAISVRRRWDRTGAAAAVDPSVRMANPGPELEVARHTESRSDSTVGGGS